MDKSIAHGGRGGRGNIFSVFATPKNPAPEISRMGNLSERELELEPKVLADVGLLAPSVGNQLFLSVITSAKPKIGLTFYNHRAKLGHGPTLRILAVADLPGLIEGAQGVGLELQFLLPHRAHLCYLACY